MRKKVFLALACIILLFAMTSCDFQLDNVFGYAEPQALPDEIKEMEFEDKKSEQKQDEKKEEGQKQEEENGSQQEQVDKKTIVYLGDSIAEAVLGPSPFIERDSLGYYGILGQINNFVYTNRSVSGATTYNMKEALNGIGYYNVEDGILRDYWIKQADVIVVSMLGNDLLGANMTSWALVTAERYTSGNETVDPRYASTLALAKNNVYKSLEAIRELNPDVKIIWQTLYNPFTDNSVLLSASGKKEFAKRQSQGKISKDYSFREIAGILVEELNQVVYDYQADYPENFYISDVYSAFNEVFDKDLSEGEKLIFGDWIHPSNRGHALIAETIQKTLEELGLSDKDYVSNYKKMVCDRLDRLYGETYLNIEKLKKNINEAKDMSAINELYFTVTEGIVPVYSVSSEPVKDGVFFKEERFYELESFTMDGISLSEIDPTLFIPELSELVSGKLELFDMSNTGFCFYEDGTCSLDIMLNDDIIGLLSALYDFAGEDIENYNILDYFTTPQFDITTLETYLTNLLPGFDIYNLYDSLACFRACGLSLIGIDGDSEEFKEFFDCISETGHLPSEITLPEHLGFRVSGYYTLETYVDGENVYTVANFYVAKTDEDSVPFIVARLFEEDEYGSQELNFRVEFARVNVECKYY